MFQHTQFITTVECINRQKEVDITHFLPLVPSLVASTLAVEHQTADLVTVHFLSDRSMKKLHKEYYNDPSSTDCMSFPIDIHEQERMGERLLGDIFICPKVAMVASKEESTSLEYELCLYTIHATLHLLGYDDIKVAERKIMRLKEQQVFEFFRNVGSTIHGTV